ncbi:hypothetical protein GGS20DRAFT_343157 [Poronia punctata]|nr:hypothetical protein GGS20DRAFT_343157 [Poronia punctata]
MVATTRFALVALSAFGLVAAQSESNSTFTIDSSQVDPYDKASWCLAQQDSCNTLCGSVLKNDCDTDTLNFECECAGEAYPDLNEYQNTIPWFVCKRLNDNCIVANENNAAGQKNCTATYDKKCGTELVDKHKGEGAASPTTSSSTSSTAGPTSATPTTTSATGNAAVPTAHIQHFGNGAAAVALGVLAYVL